MKYVVVLCDGMSDYPIEALGGKTPMEAAYKPFMDKLARQAELGLAKTVPAGMKPGSDVANLAVMGYDPAKYYSGRSPLEALSMGINLLDTQIAMRCNLVTVSDEPDYKDKTMIDYSSGEITTQEAAELIEYLKNKLPVSGVQLYAGVSYRHCLVIDNATLGTEMTPPHDISGQKVRLPKGLYADMLTRIMAWSYGMLKDHPVNKARVAAGKNPANSMWFWGEGVRPNLSPFTQKTGVKGAVISAVDLLKGIGVGAGMEVINVPGATGGLDTDYSGKAHAAFEALSRNDYVYVHVEAPDEMGHHGYIKEKVQAIENIDKYIVSYLTESLSKSNIPYRMLICPDHPTPISTRTHASDPVPYLIYDPTNEVANVECFSEKTCAATGIYVENGYTLVDRLIK